MKDIPKLSIDDDWIVEVTEFAVEKFCWWRINKRTW
jgi:hypothetical protein